MDKLNLQNRVAIVTGSTHGIGLVIALTLAEHGAIVWINSRDKQAVEDVITKYIKEIPVCGFAGDVSQEEFVKTFTGTVMQKSGRLDILVNNAAARHQRTPLKDLEIKQWDNSINNTLRSMFLMSRETAKHMENNGSGAIINISSTVGYIRGRSGGADYAAAKTGVIGLTKELAVELGSLNIRVNAVAPGLTDTKTMRALNSQEFRSLAVEKTPLRRIGSAYDIANAVLFLASPLAGFITGQTLVVDGGRNIAQFN